MLKIRTHLSALALSVCAAVALSGCAASAQSNTAAPAAAEEHNMIVPAQLNLETKWDKTGGLTLSPDL